MDSTENLNIFTEEYTNVYRLPDNVKPIKYSLTLDPDLSKGTFNGHIIIDLQVIQSTGSILLNAHRLTVKSIRVYQKTDLDQEPSDAAVVDVKGVYIQKQRQLLIIKLDTVLTEGYYRIVLAYSGKLNSESIGLYRTKISSSDQEPRYCAATYFEPTYARMAYPCFDEPHFKSKYCTSLVKPASDEYIALSNSSVKLEVVDFPRPGVTTVHFNETPPISSYLTCFIIGVFQSLESAMALSGRVPVSVYSLPDLVEQTSTARDLAAQILDYFSKYFQIDYPFPKLDLIAIPDSKLGGMENWGLITFRDLALLVNKHESSTSDYLYVVKVIIHELSHMWFGNLVTIAWWNDTWLKEGMADFMSYIGGNHAFPEWYNEWVFLSGQVYPALQKDCALSSRPVIYAVSHPDQIREMFDSISYLKGSCLIRMIHDLDPDKFRKGLNAYVHKMKWSDARTCDLWESLSKTLGWAVGDIMGPWTEQAGYPVINIVEQDTEYLVTQKRFLTDSSAHFESSESPYFYKWDVPIKFITSHCKEPQLYWFYRENDTGVISLPKNVSWIKLNWHNVGFYRVNYTTEMWLSFAQMLQKDTNVFDAEDRCNLINDAFCLASSGYIKYDIPLNLIMYLKDGKEDNFLVWSVVKDHLEKIQALLMTSQQSLLLFNKYVQILMKQIVDNLDWETGEHVPYMERKLRVELIGLACLLGFEPVLNEIRSIYSDWIEKKKSRPCSEIRAIVHTYGLSGSGNQVEELWMKTWQQYINEKQPSEILNLIRSLVSTSNPDLITKLITEAKNQDVVRSQDFFILLRLISKTAVGNKMVWAFIRNEWPYLVCRFTLNDLGLGRTVSFVTNNFSTHQQLEEVEEFFAKYPDAGAGTSERKHAIEAIKSNIKWKNNHQQFLNNYFQQL